MTGVFRASIHISSSGLQNLKAVLYCHEKSFKFCPSNGDGRYPDEEDSSLNKFNPLQDHHRQYNRVNKLIEFMTTFLPVWTSNEINHLPVVVVVAVVVVVVVADVVMMILQRHLSR